MLLVISLPNEKLRGNGAGCIMRRYLKGSRLKSDGGAVN